MRHLYHHIIAYKWLIIILLFFSTIYCSISLVNHYNFRTYGYDLGIYNNTLYDYSLFRVNNNSVMHKEFDNILSDHFSLYHMFFAPFRFIFGSYTLLIFQILSILFGALGIYKLLFYLSNNSVFARIGVFHFLSMWGIFSALSFDYHDNVVASMFVPWLILAVLQKNKIQILLYTLLIFISRENMSLWLAFVFAGIWIWKYKDSTIRRLSLYGGVASILYFLLVIKIIMPSLANEGTTYAHLKYTVLGESTKEYVITLLTRPQYVFSLLFENHTGDALYNGIKSELFFVMILSGGLAFFYKPQFLIMVIPIIIQKVFNDDPGKWGINYHYSVEFAPILTIALAVWILDAIEVSRKRNIAFLLGAVLCFAVSMSVIDSRVSKWYDSKALRFWDSRHYKRSFDVAFVHDALKHIPKDANVCAQNMLVPHLAFRDRIYTFPHVRDADYVALLPGAYHPYPVTEQEYWNIIEKLQEDFSIVIQTDDFLLLQRK